MLYFATDAIRRYSIRVLVFGLIPLVAATVFGQGGVGSTRGLPDSSAGIHTIQGLIYLPNGRRAGPGISVRLEGNVMGSRNAPTDLDGSFIFRSLPAADYSISIDGGADYESVRESVTIYGNTGGVQGIGSSGQTLMLDVHLRPKGSAANSEAAFAGIPKPAVDSYKRAMDLVSAGDTKKAIEQFNGALATYPNFPQALSDLGLQYMKLGKMDKAAETFEGLLKLKPSDASAHLNLGIALYNQGNLEAAETNLREALKVNSPAPSAHYYLGMTLIKTKRYEGAQKELELAIANGGENLALAHKFLGGLYMSARRNKEAADELEKYLKLDPKAADADRIKGTIKDLRSRQ